MDPMQFAAVSRAHNALDTAIANESHRLKVKGFVDLVWTMFHCNEGQFLQTAKQHPNALVKAAAENTLSGVWQGEDGRALAEAYLASIAEESLLDQVKRYARILPLRSTRTMVASGFSANVTAEGDPKVVKTFQATVDTDEAIKSAVVVVMTQELAKATGPQGRALFENELRLAVLRATNRAVLDAMESTDTEFVTGTGDPLEDLRIGLKAAGPSSGYVVAAPATAVIDLATRVENRGGMGVRGGSFIPGVDVVAMDDLTEMRIIPASRVAVWDGGLEVRSAEHASVTFAETPTSPSNVVSLWQTNSLGLLGERSFLLVPSAELVVVAEGS